MEQVHTQDPDKVALDSFYKPGSMVDSEEEKPEDKVVEGETEEESEDVSEDEDEGEDEGDAIEDDEEELDETPDEDEDDAEVKAREAEKKRRGFQSENTKLKSKNKDLEDKLTGLQHRINQIEANQYQNQESAQQEDELEDLKQILTGDPDDFPTNAKIVKLIERIDKRNKEPRKTQRSSQHRTSWMQTQPDFAQVSEYASKHNLATDPYFSGATTDETGAYFAVRARIQDEKLRKAEDELRKIKKIAKKRRKGRVPITGAGGATARAPKGGKKDGVASFWGKFDGSW